MKTPSFLDTRVSKKDICPLFSVSIVKEIFGSIELRVSWKVETEDGVVTIDVYRKSTHTDRYLDFYSHHEKKHKISTASILLNRASNLPSTSAGKSKELIYVSNALESNGYPPSFISNILKKKPPPETTPSPEELVGMFFKWADPSNSDSGFAVLLYIKGLTEPLSRLLRNNGIRTTRRPLKTLQQDICFPQVKTTG